MNSEESVRSDQYLTFTLGEDVFALEIAKVREVVDCTAITKVPRMPDYLCGVINLRGNVVSLVDLRLKMGMDAIKNREESCIVIAEVNMEGENLQVGVIMDSVREVIELSPEQIEPCPKLGTGLNTGFIQGMGRQQDEFVMIIDIDRVFSGRFTGEQLSENTGEAV